MSEKIRMGVIGANSRHGWAGRTHVPAILSSSEFDLVGVCTTRQESAEESAQLYGAKLAFHDYHDMVTHPDIDAVAVVVRAPSHFLPTKAAIEAGKPVYTEWPLGRTSAEAVELTELAKTQGVVTAVGLQGRMNPTIMYMKDLITNGYVGDIMSCHLSFFHQAHLERPIERIWQHDASAGGNTLTIANGHTMDILTYLAGTFSSLSSLVTTQNSRWRLSDTNELVEVDAPDTVVVNGCLSSGAVVSSHVAATTRPGSGFRLEIYGSEGRLISTAATHPQSYEHSLQGAKGDQPLERMKTPQQYFFVAPIDPATFKGEIDQTMPRGSAYNVAQLYHRFAQAIQKGDGHQPTFADAVGLHHLLDAITRAAESGTQQLALG